MAKKNVIPAKKALAVVKNAMAKKTAKAKATIAKKADKAARKKANPASVAAAAERVAEKAPAKTKRVPAPDLKRDVTPKGLLPYFKVTSKPDADENLSEATLAIIAGGKRETLFYQGPDAEKEAVWAAHLLNEVVKRAVADEVKAQK